MKQEFNISWMDETIEQLPKSQRMYRLCCYMLLKRRMTYSNMYVLIYALNKNKYKDKETELKEKIIKELAAIYLYNNNTLPDGFEFIE